MRKARKCADALCELGYTASTSQGGSGRARETDWTPAAAAARVLIWQDCDEPGRDGVVPGERYAGDVAALISDAAAIGERSAPEILIIDLREQLQPGQDVFDLIEGLKTDGKSDAEICATLNELASKYGRRWFRAAEVSYPDQPAPYPGLKGPRRPLKNHVPSEPDEQGKRQSTAQPIDSIYADLAAITNGWPCCVRSPGSHTPLLFVDEAGRHEVRFITTSEQFAAWTHEVAQPNFHSKQDKNGANFVQPTHLFHFIGGSKAIPQFLAIQPMPHEPLIKGHYYLWRPPANYSADGRRFAGLLEFFKNVKDPASRAVMAAALMCPGAGLPYGKRPAFCITAPDRGCGKSTLAWAIGKVWGGSISVDFSQRGEDQLVTRLLSPEALLKVCCIVDNVKGQLSNAKLEALITDEWINGHALYRGDSSRPNVLTWFITANGVRLSRDMAQRSYFVELVKPGYCADWDKKLSEYLALYSHEIVADVMAILRTGKAQKSLGLDDRWSRFAEEVLVPACTHPALRDFVGVDVAAVLDATRKLREECDEDREECEMFVQGLLQRICGMGDERCRGAGLIEGPLMNQSMDQSRESIQARNGDWFTLRMPKEAFLVKSDEIVAHWEAIFKKKLNVKQIKHILRAACEAGWITGLECDVHTKSGNVYRVSLALLTKYVEGFKKALQAEQEPAAVG